MTFKSAALLESSAETPARLSLRRSEMTLIAHCLTPQPVFAVEARDGRAEFMNSEIESRRMLTARL